MSHGYLPVNVVVMFRGEKGEPVGPTKLYDFATKKDRLFGPCRYCHPVFLISNTPTK